MLATQVLLLSLRPVRALLLAIAGAWQEGCMLYNVCVRTRVQTVISKYLVY